MLMFSPVTVIGKRYVTDRPKLWNQYRVCLLALGFRTEPRLRKRTRSQNLWKLSQTLRIRLALGNPTISSYAFHGVSCLSRNLCI